MTIQELINDLERYEDKSLEVKISAQGRKPETIEVLWVGINTLYIEVIKRQ